MVSFVVDIDFAAIDDDQLFFLVVAGKNGFLRFVDASNQLKGDFVLEVDGEVGEEKYALFDDSNIGLQYELLFEGAIDIRQELPLLIIFERCFFHFRLLLLNITLHLIAQLSTQVVMVLKFHYG